MRTGILARLGTLVILLVVSFGGVGSSCFESPDPCKSSSWKDFDSDNMSDATEENPTNAYLHLNSVDATDDPSLAIGSPSSGSLTNGINLTDRSGSCGYIHYYGDDGLDSDDWGIAKVLLVVENISRLWAISRDYYVQSGDISRQGGGSFPPHTSHQNGLDVDVRYVRWDHALVPVSLDPNDPYGRYAQLDTVATNSLIHLFAAQAEVRFIYVNQNAPVESDPKIIWRTDHDDHFHVEVYWGKVN